MVVYSRLSTLNSRLRLIMQQQARPVSTDIDVVVAVTVIIADGAPEEVTGQFVQTRSAGRIDEMPASVSAIERKFGADEEDVEVAVVIVVEECAAIADRLKDIQRALA